MNTIFILFLSFVALLWGANHVVVGSSGLAIRLKCSPFIIGLTIVALGTSTPEILTAFISSIKDKNDLTLGNAIGANIANIGLVLGTTMLIKPMLLNYNVLKNAYPLLMISMLFIYSLILDGFLSQADGCLFLIACIALISFFIYLTNETPNQDLMFKKFKSTARSGRSLKANILSVCMGLLILPVSAKYIILSTAQLAIWAGVSELTINLTILAIGTTLPELVTSITAALKGEEDIAIGTILGSNIYNLLLLMAFPAIINPSRVNNYILWRDMPVMMSLTLLLIFLNIYYKDKPSRWYGGILLLVYCSYIISIIIRAHA